MCVTFSAILKHTIPLAKPGCVSFLSSFSLGYISSFTFSTFSISQQIETMFPFANAFHILAN